MVGGEPANGSPNRLYRTLGDQKVWNAETGATGSIGETWRWDDAAKADIKDYNLLDLSI